jgi:translation initiation factor 2B subunit (eIF-2B alpha/beta/delta family)
MKGKHGAIAARRDIANATESQIADYQRKVRDLTAELKDLRSTAANDRDLSAETIRLLRIRLREVTSPQVEALRLENMRLVNNVAEERTKRLAVERKYTAQSRRLMRNVEEAGSDWTDEDIAPVGKQMIARVRGLRARSGQGPL